MTLRGLEELEEIFVYLRSRSASSPELRTGRREGGGREGEREGEGEGEGGREGEISRGWRALSTDCSCEEREGVREKKMTERRIMQ